MSRLRSSVAQTCDIAVIGCGAAGLMAAIWAGRTEPGTRIIGLDGARTLGAKILVAGGGRCNVTHHAVDETAYACGEGTTRNAIRKVLRSFAVERTVQFFSELGVELKREDTGKLFPVTDEARTVLNALLGACRAAGVELRHPWRVQAVRRDATGFVIEPTDGAAGPLAARRVVLAAGGMALPRTGSDGHGYSIARALGHTVTEPIFPALVPLTLDAARSFIPSLSGLTLPATLTLHSGTGKKLVEFTNSTLCTHFGLSGPSVLDISRYWLDFRRRDPAAMLSINWIPGQTPESLDQLLSPTGPRAGQSALRVLGEWLPERLARAICEHATVEPAAMVRTLTRDQRRSLGRAAAAMLLPITGDRGFTHAEVTAGGVPLSEIRLETMESRVCPGLHLCGEICDVDGRIGGFNFQWAWASGYLAGCGAARALAQPVSGEPA